MSKPLCIDLCGGLGGWAEGFLAVMICHAKIVAEIERCDREIAEIEARPPGSPAYLTTLGIEDWRWEKRLLESMLVEKSDESYEASAAVFEMRKRCESPRSESPLSGRPTALSARTP